jgi:hypothetical protein
MNHLQHTSETIETYAFNMRVQRNISYLFGRMQACRRVEFTGASSPAIPAARRGREASVVRHRMETVAAGLEEGRRTPHLAGPAAEHRDLEEAARRAWQGRRPSTAPRRRPFAAPSWASGRALEAQASG